MRKLKQGKRVWWNSLDQMLRCPIGGKYRGDISKSKCNCEERLVEREG